MPNIEKAREEVKQQLNELLLTYSTSFTQVASEVVGRPLHFNFSRRDQLRILNLYTWAEKYHIPVDEILKVLLNVWSKRFVRRPRGLGVAIGTLTGIRSKDILSEYVRKKYASRENIAKEKESKILELTPAEDELECTDPLSFITEYKSRLKSLRDNDNKLIEKFKRRRWRGNPVF